MSVKRVGSGPRPWKVRLRVRGKDTLRSFPNKKLAEEYEADVKKARARELAGMAVEQGPITYTALVDLYLAGYTERSKPWLELMLSYGTTRFGQVQVRHLRPEEIAKWIHTDLSLAPKTKQHILTAMRQVLTTGIEWGYLHRDPTKSVRRPKAAPKPVQPLESWAEVLAVAEATGHYSNAIRFACATGLRPGEWMALRWSDIDYSAKLVHIRRTLSGENVGKTEGSLRAVVLSAPALRALADLVRPLDSEALIFTSKRGHALRPRPFNEKVWKPALDALGLARRNAYQTRHTYATLALAQGVPLEWISKQMGHRDINITIKHYARFVKVVDERMRGLLDGMEDADGSTNAARQI